jgi:hypothetical protein
MAAADIAGIQRIIEGLTGVRAVRRLGEEDRRRLARIETDYEAGSAIPVRNIGVRSAACRAEAFVVLKDSRFRPPPAPTVYLVEEMGDPAAVSAAMSFEIRVEGGRYRVIGEEILGSAEGFGDDVFFLADTFVMFPARRTSAHVPCLFILPPIPFPELEARRAELAIEDIVSVSPSLAVDMHLRDMCGFPKTNELATLLIGFNPAP